MRRSAFGVAAALVVVASCGAPPKTASDAAPSATAAAPASTVEPPRTPPNGAPIQLDCGDFTTCAVADGGEARCWGSDKAGELGDGGGADRTRDAGVPGLAKVAVIAMASQFGCALLVDKTVQCWGTGLIANDGKKVQKAKATPVQGVSGALELVASGVVACARTERDVTCWGAPASTIGTPPKGAWTQIAAGFTHACALDAGGAVQCWGINEWAPSGGYARPAGIAGALYLATGDRHACVIAKDRRVLCWGQNDTGQLGTKPDNEAHKKPVVVAGVAGAVKLAAGEASTCALLADGTARCWGANPEGELGLGKRSSDERPIKVGTLGDLADVCLASTHGCALTKNGKIMCWGYNVHGQLGDGTKERRLEPAIVDW